MYLVSLDPDPDVSESGSNADLDPGQGYFMVFLNPYQGHSGSSPTKISSDMTFLNFFPFVGDNFRMPGSGSNPDPIHWIEHNGVKHKCSTVRKIFLVMHMIPVPSSWSVIYRTLDYSTLVVSCFSSLSLSVWRFYFRGKISQSFQLYSRSPLLLQNIKKFKRVFFLQQSVCSISVSYKPSVSKDKVFLVDNNISFALLNGRKEWSKDSLYEHGFRNLAS
jgi:hypothetical protein